MEENTYDLPDNLSATQIKTKDYEPPMVEFLELTTENGFAASSQTDTWLHDEWI